MLYRIITLSTFYLLVSCESQVSSSDLFNIALDNQLSIHSVGCSFSSTELLLNSERDILNNSCAERASHRLEYITEEFVKKKLFLQRGHSFLDSVNFARINKYLSHSNGLPYYEKLSPSYEYSNKKILNGYSVVSEKELFRDWHPNSACLIEVTDVYYSSNRSKAVLGLLNYCGVSEVYTIYYFININGVWVINFVEIGD
jgi:hypothetical protein